MEKVIDALTFGGCIGVVIGAATLFLMNLKVTVSVEIISLACVLSAMVLSGIYGYGEEKDQ